MVEAVPQGRNLKAAVAGAGLVLPQIKMAEIQPVVPVVLLVSIIQVLVGLEPGVLVEPQPAVTRHLAAAAAAAQMTAHTAARAELRCLAGPVAVTEGR